MSPAARKARLPIRKGKAVPAPFLAELDAESKEILHLISSIGSARGDITKLIDALQLRFAARAAVDEEVLFPHADERLTKREHREALARAQLRSGVVDVLLARAAAIAGVAERSAWCALAGAEAAALFEEERKLRTAFHPDDLRSLHRDATSVRAAVAAAFAER
jgi:hypothetical protein